MAQTPRVDLHILEHLTAIKLALQSLGRVGSLNQRQRGTIQIALDSTDRLIADLILGEAQAGKPRGSPGG